MTTDSKERVLLEGKVIPSWRAWVPKGSPRVRLVADRVQDGQIMLSTPRQEPIHDHR